MDWRNDYLSLLDTLPHKRSHLFYSFFAQYLTQFLSLASVLAKNPNGLDTLIPKLLDVTRNGSHHIRM